MRAPIGASNAPEELDAVIREWERLWHANGLVADVEHASHSDNKGQYHWMIRLRGDEKDVIALWLTLRQRTVHFETQVMPAPEEHFETLYKYLLEECGTSRPASRDWPRRGHLSTDAGPHWRGDARATR
jgi:hypothetical protein